MLSNNSLKLQKCKHKRKIRKFKPSRKIKKAIRYGIKTVTEYLKY